MSVEEDLEALKAALANGAAIGPTDKGPVGFPLKVESIDATLRKTTYTMDEYPTLRWLRMLSGPQEVEFGPKPSRDNLPTWGYSLIRLYGSDI